MSGIEWIPREGMEFSSTEEAWDFWLKYGGKVGFHVRRGNFFFVYPYNKKEFYNYPHFETIAKIIPIL